MDKIVLKLQRLGLEIEDLNNISPDLIQELFLDLSVVEISKLCRLNTKFNSVCLRESLWNSKVWIDYGIEKKYGDTWRETAKNLSQLNMINLNETWVNRKTYKEIMDESMDTKENSFTHVTNLLQTEFEAAIGVGIMDKFHMSLFNEEELKTYGKSRLGRNLRSGELDKLRLIFTREFHVIVKTLQIYGAYFPNLPGIGLAFASRLRSRPIPRRNRNLRSSHPIVMKFFDINLYIMDFSSEIQ
uniref:F-box domain-containing protein n=1 Tax=Pithovirus LCPAC406 TaxID=2506599 RepID=A0A481ZGM6_9VIRU|nr:MAG: hypothetical protein LCPAC406_01930 [Pithovirus LCPAC406]